MHELKAGLNADKFATFWILPKIGVPAELAVFGVSQSWE